MLYDVSRLGDLSYVDPATSTSTDLAFTQLETTAMNMIDAITTTLSRAAMVSIMLQMMIGPRRRMTMKKEMNALVVFLNTVLEDT